MVKHPLSLLVIPLILLAGTSDGMAHNAELLLSPTRIVLENGARYATVTVKNTGDGVGRYVIEVIALPEWMKMAGSSCLIPV